MITEAAVALRQKLNQFGEPGTIPPSLIRDVIRASTWWTTHPQSPTRAPGFSDRVTQSQHGWEVQFGSNHFLVERAVLLSKEVILQELDRASTLNGLIDRQLLYERLITCVRKSVAGYNHEIIEYYKGGASPAVKQDPLFNIGQDEPLERVGRLIIGGRYQRYGDLPPSKDIWDGFMQMGSHAIKVAEFIDQIWRWANLDSVSVQHQTAS